MSTINPNCYRKINMYLQEHKLLSNKQAGFRWYYGVHDPLIDLTTFVNRNFNKGKIVLCIYVDLARAFNSLDNSIIVDKIEKLGFKDNMLQLLRDYTLNRKQVMNLDDNLSSVGTVKYGVAQGSVLWPLLLSLYMNNLPDIFNILDLRIHVCWRYDLILWTRQHQLQLNNQGICSE